jgi:hypothetical protein
MQESNGGEGFCMTFGALIGAYQEDGAGSLAALQPLAGRTLIEYQARCAAAAGAAPIVVLVEKVPVALAAAIERLRAEGISVVPVSDAAEAASRFEAHSLLLQMADGVAPAMGLVERVVVIEERAVATVPDSEAHAAFERIDNGHRWAGLALVDAGTLSSTAAMLGDWDLQSTLLRRTIQAGAVQVPADEALAPFLAAPGSDPQAFDRHLLVASRQARRDWPSRYLFPIVEEFATEQLMRSPVRPAWLVLSALLMTLVAALCFSRGWHWPGLVLLLLASPIDLIAERLGQLRLQPLPTGLLARRLLWPAGGLALLALGWWESRHGGGWGAFASAVAAIAFAEAQRIEVSGRSAPPFETWLFGLRPAVVAALPFAAFGWWTGLIAFLALYACVSFFLSQHWVHRIQRD